MSEVIDLTESLEDYLETIYILEKKDRVARTSDIATYMHVKKASVTSALNNLAEKRLINYEPYKFITLTAKGSRIAKGLYKRHVTLTGFFTKVLGIKEAEAESLGCRLEHIIKGDNFNRFLKFIEFMNECPHFSTDWGVLFDKYCRGEIEASKCKSCMVESLRDSENLSVNDE